MSESEMAKIAGLPPKYGRIPVPDGFAAAVQKIAGATTTLTDFLLARIAEDEEIAESARIWYPSDTHEGMDEAEWMDAEWWQSAGLDRRHAAFAHKQSPARALAECEAKRRIVAWDDDQLEEHAVLRLLALPYADHSDYCDEWKP